MMDPEFWESHYQRFSVTEELLISRDKRGIYSQDSAKSGPFVGKDFSPQYPQHPDVHIKLDGTVSVESCGELVLNAFNTARRNK